MSFDKVRQPLRMSEAITRQVEDQVHQGLLQPGEMLPSENDLMKEFGVGRNTVREALRMLETSGIVRIKQGARGGALISRMTNEFVSDFLVKSFRLGGVSPEAFHTFRFAVEPSIAEIVAGRADVDESILARMEDKIVEARALYEAKEPTAYANMDFHVLLAEATGNMIFTVVLKTLRAGFMTVTPHTRERFRPETIEYHERILAAIRKHDPSEAREQMHLHLQQLGGGLKDGYLLHSE